MAGSYDVVIVGGGISGLYTAWRLASNTTYSIAVLEYSDRFGGRYRTCQMPGGFLADLGAMRYSPESQPILHQLIADMNLQTEPFFSQQNDAMSRVYYVRNKFCRNVDEVKKLYEIRSEDETYLATGSVAHTQLPENGNYYRATLKGSSTQAKNVTLRQFWWESMNSGVVEYHSVESVGSRALAEDCGVKKPYTNSTDTKSLNYSRLMAISKGAESVIAALVSQLKSLGVTLLKQHAVTRIQELRSSMHNQYNVKAKLSEGDVVWFSTKKVILACNARGLETVTWESEFDRVQSIQRLLGKINKISTVKAALTYRRAWWEDKQVKCGSLVSDMPISKVSIMGERAKKNGFATIYVSSFNRAEVFTALNSEDEQRFHCSDGSVSPDLVPSLAVVESIQKQLKVAFDVEIPDPVSACMSTWSEDPIGYCWYAPKAGVDHNAIYWKSLKPFGENDEMYVVGDVFSAVTPEAIYTSFSEGALLTAERVLHKYFKLKPYRDNLCLNNPWPEDSIVEG